MLHGCGDDRRDPPVATAPPPSLAPAKDAVGTVVIDYSGRYAKALIATARLPDGYEFQQIEGYLFAHGPGPRIRIAIGTTGQPTQKTTASEEWVDENCRSTARIQEPGYYTVMSHQASADGFVNVCVHRKPRFTSQLEVIRRWEWHGFPAQCEFAFFEGKLNEGAIEPTETQIANAIAVCNTVTFEPKRFQPPKDGTQP